MDEKMQKFEELAQQRVEKAIHAIDLIGKLSSPAYHYTPQHVEQIFGALMGAVTENKKKFAPKQKPAAKSFSFSGIHDNEEDDAEFRKENTSFSTETTEDM